MIKELYEEVSASLLTRLRNQDGGTEWGIETWEEFEARTERGFIDADAPFAVKWKAKGKSGTLYFNSALLIELGAEWLGDALVDMIRKDTAEDGKGKGQSA